MTIRYLLTAGAVALGIACGPSTALAQSDVPIISREVLFGNPNKASPRISPDGHKLSFLAPVGGALNVWVGPIDRPAMAKPVTNDTGRGIRSYFWAHTNQHILYLQDVGGDDNWRLFSIDLRTGHQMPLTPDSDTAPDETMSHKVTTRVQHISYKFPHEVLVGLNDRDPRFHDLYRVNIDTGELVGVQFNEGFLRFYTDDDIQIRLAARLRPDGGNDLMIPSTDGGWEVFDTISMADLRTTGPVDFDKTGERVYFVDSRGRNTASLKSINVKTRAAKPLA